MKISVANFRRIRSAALDVAPIALVGGQNEAGKTSLAQAAIAVLAGRPLPVGSVVAGKLKPLVGKGAAGMHLVRDGMATGSAELTGDSGSSTARWPECSYSTAGSPPTASMWAAGGASIVDLDTAGRAKVLIEILDAMPKDIPADVQSWLDNAAGDWDGAHAAAAANGQQLKGEWRAASGVPYGSTKAKSWQPDGYDGRAIDILRAEVTAASAAVDIAVGRVAVSVADLRRDRDLASRADEIASAVQKMQDAAAHDRRNLEAAQAALDAAPHAWGDSGLPCPWCGQNVRQSLGGSGLERVDLGMSREEHDRIYNARASAEKALKEARQKEAASRQMCDELAVELRAAHAAADRAKAAGDNPSGNAGDIDAAKAKLAGAKMCLAASEAHARAREIAGRIVGNQNVIDMLAPTGLRKSALEAALVAFNDRVASICRLAKWPPVSIEQDMSIERDGVPLALVSASAQYRARVAIQVTIAQLQGAAMMVIDGFDILDKGGRNGLLKMLSAVGIPSLLTATFSAREVMPDLGRAGLGRSYWLNGGCLEDAGGTNG